MIARLVSLKHTAVGLAAGAALWAILGLLLPFVPDVLKGIVVTVLFIAGPGLAVTVPLTQGLSRFEGSIVGLGAGLGFAPLLAHGLTFAHALDAYPWIASAALGAALSSRTSTIGPAAPKGLVAAVAATVLLAGGLGWTAYAGRLERTAERVVVYGEYDSFDSTYYAALSSELAAEPSPRSPFHEARPLNYSYYSQFILALVHRFAGVPLLTLYFGPGWTTYLGILAAIGCVLGVRLMAIRGAVASVVLLLLGSDFSYLVKLTRAADGGVWDPVIWSSNLLSPSAETLLFNTWTPALALLLTVVFALDRFQHETRTGWLLLGGVLAGLLIQFKPFAFAPLTAGLAMTGLMRRGVKPASWTTLAVALGVATPFLVRAIQLREESQAQLTLDPLLLPRRLAMKLPALLPGSPDDALTLVLSTCLLLVGGFGVRLIGARIVANGLWHRDESLAWATIAWTLVAATGIPFVIGTEPYYQTVHFFQTALFLGWFFVGRAIANWSTRGSGIAVATTFVLGAVASPSTINYLIRKRTDRTRPFAELTTDGRVIASTLGALPRRDVLFMAPDPARPSLIGIESGRRTLLAWSAYAPNSAALASDIERFYNGQMRDPTERRTFLRTRRVTHVVAPASGEWGEDDGLRPVVRTRTMVLYEVE